MQLHVKLVFERTGALKNVLNQGSRHAGRITEALRQVEDKTVSGVRCCCERLVGSVALSDCYSALPVGKAGKAESEHQSSGKAAGDDIAPPSRAAPAVCDKRLRLRRRLRRTARA